MNNLITRAIWGSVFVLIVIGAILLGKYATSIVIGAFMMVGLIEFNKLFQLSKNISPYFNLSIFGGFLIYLLSLAFLFDYITLPYLLTGCILLCFTPFIHFVLSKENNTLFRLALTFTSWIYVVIPFLLMILIYQAGQEKQWIYLIGLFLLIWTNDTFAYLSGRQFGKHKLLERISPKKTWEGAIGGFLFTIIVAGLYAWNFSLDFAFWITAAALISPIGIFGDLIESKLKRSVKIKDSGNIIPGHGGVLDRFDAIMFATPFFYLLILLFQ